MLDTHALITDCLPASLAASCVVLLYNPVCMHSFTAFVRHIIVINACFICMCMLLPPCGLCILMGYAQCVFPLLHTAPATLCACYSVHVVGFSESLFASLVGVVSFVLVLHVYTHVVDLTLTQSLSPLTKSNRTHAHTVCLLACINCCVSYTALSQAVDG